MSATDAFFADLASRLLARAKVLAVQRLLARRGDARRWRRAGLLWPTFGKD